MDNLRASDLHFAYFNIGNGFFKNENGVRITHKPSGQVFESSESQRKMLNRNYCLNMLQEFLKTWKPKVKYIIQAYQANIAREIARSFSLGPQDYIYVGHNTPCGLYGLPIGFRPDLSICTISQEASNKYTMDVVHREWHEFLFNILPEEQKQKFLDRVSETLEGFLWCDRVWEAWSVGTMSQDDFSPAGTDEVIYEHAVSMYIMFLEMQK